MRDLNDKDKARYREDFPDAGSFNWRRVELDMPGKVYLHGSSVTGVLLHDGRFMTNGVLFEAGEFRVTDEDPLRLKENTNTKTT